MLVKSSWLYLIVDRHVDVRNQDIIVANYNGAFVCKIIDKVNRLLLSANEAHMSTPILEHDTFSVEGVVIRSIRCHRKSPILEND